MARISYPDLESSPELKALTTQIISERGKLHNLYKMLLNSPPIAEGWLNLLTAVRQKSLLSGRVRELVIMRIAVINKAEYEFISHTPFALKEGITQAQIDEIPHWEKSSLFDPIDRAVMGYTDSMTRDVHVPKAIFDEVNQHFDARGMTELTATIAAYNLVSRFLEALEIDPEPK
ncbi:carboxymuconolactone decarboxylase family protein [Polynucleobacter sp. VK25]|uniref:carboxymuconolactone decarboxylase family protein n=1 Tax=Polynucleobacter sp. VK25 TaxID=1758398 RepID=UPI001BFCDDF5|nr:carboxymuconolactone decarboxylase family protein [Polynucleobacter sp. VK25]QWD67796.1 carboxymuconolactone decarboxylase family protein [Polynucleobacter sp. VK25]